MIFLVNFLSIHPHWGRFLEPHLSQGESLDKEFHRCVKVLLEPDKSLGLEVEETSKKRTFPPGPKGRSSIPLLSSFGVVKIPINLFYHIQKEKNAICRQTKQKNHLSGSFFWFCGTVFVLGRVYSSINLGNERTMVFDFQGIRILFGFKGWFLLHYLLPCGQDSITRKSWTFF